MKDEADGVLMLMVNDDGNIGGWSCWLDEVMKDKDDDRGKMEQDYGFDGEEGTLQW